MSFCFVGLPFYQSASWPLSFLSLFLSFSSSSDLAWFMRDCLRWVGLLCVCNGARINIAAHRWRRRSNHLLGNTGPNWATGKEDWTSITGENIGTWRSPLSRGGEEQHLTLVPGLGRERRVQPVFIEEGSQSLSSSSLISYVFQLLWYYV